MSDYPERKPEQLLPLENFKFSLASAEHASEDLDYRIEALENRVRKLEDASLITVGGQKIPLLMNILQLSHDRNELKKLSECLGRAAELTEELDRLRDQRKVVELAKKDVGFFAWAFSDFSQPIDDIEILLNKEA